MGNCVVQISVNGRVVLRRGDEVIIVMARPTRRTHTSLAIAAEKGWRISREEPDDDNRYRAGSASTDGNR